MAKKKESRLPTTCGGCLTSFVDGTSQENATACAAHLAHCEAVKLFTVRTQLMRRSRWQCEAELFDDSDGLWFRCPKLGNQAAHIYTRRRCGRARDLVEAVIWTCQEHNLNHLDGREGVRAPLPYRIMAWEKIVELAKDQASTLSLVGSHP